ncbi:VWA domain-containing protein, partial [bacterium]
GGRVKTGLLVEKTENGGYLSLVLQPPAELSAIARTPLELVFVVDTSGSMAGWPIETAKKAMLRALRNLNAEDTFQIIRFGNDSSAFSRAPLAATGENIRQAADFVQNLQASGGTMMIGGVKNALNFPHDPKRLRVVSFMTDGFIGNEAEILAAVNQLLGPSRIFSFGIGSSVNRYLIDNLAKFGRGAVAYVTTNSSPIEAIDKFYDVIAHQTLNNVSIDLAGVKTSGGYPERIPDLFIGRPVVVTGRFSGEMPETITVRGTVAGEPRLFKARTDTGTEAKGISKLWARARIADYSNRIITEGPKNDLVYQVRETALAHNLVSDYTSFVAVDGSRRTQGDHGFTVNVPVPVPEGVRYDTTVTPSR